MGLGFLLSFEITPTFYIRFSSVCTLALSGRGTYVSGCVQSLGLSILMVYISFIVLKLIQVWVGIAFQAVVTSFGIRVTVPRTSSGLSVYYVTRECINKL